MTGRIQRLLDEVVRDKYEVVCTKTKLFTEKYRELEGTPDVIRTAKAQAYMLERIPIFMLEDELIPIAPASKPLSLEADCWMLGIWSDESIKVLQDPKNTYFCSDETAKDLKELGEYWRERASIYKLQDLYDLDPKMWAWKKSGFLLPRNKTREEAAGSGLAVSCLSIFPDYEYINMDYEYIFHKGLRQVINEAKEELRKVDLFEIKSDDDIERIYTLQAMIIINEGVIRFVNRYADLAESMIQEGVSEKREKELRDIIDTCRRIPEFPCKTLLDAMTFQWLMLLMINNTNTTPIGRADQWGYPYYLNDIKNGRLDHDKTLELIQCFRLKYMQIKSTSGGATVKKWSGQANWRGMTLGGVKPDGTDAANELSYLFIEAAKDCRTPFPTISLRVYDGMPDNLLRAGIDLCRTGIGYPSFVGDKSYIAGLEYKDVPEKIARDYFIAGCVDHNAPGAWSMLFGTTVAAFPLDTFLHRGYSPVEKMQVAPDMGDPREMKTFEEFFNKLMEQERFFMKGYCAEWGIRYRLRRNFLQDCFIVSTLPGGVQEGHTQMRRKLPFHAGPSICIGCGTVTMAQSLTVIKTLVYDEKKITMDELLNALDSNWEGERNQEIRRMCMNIPYYGNNEPESDEMVAKVYNSLIDIAESLDTWVEGPDGRLQKASAGAVSITSHEPGGNIIGATPDGRYAGTVLSDACASPIQGTDVNGPTSVFNSVLHLPADRMTSLLLNQKISPSCLQTDEDMDKLAAMLKTFFNAGGKQIQYNVVDNAVLRDAKVHPEEHKDLIVRVAGYSAYFTNLSDTIQNEIIARNEHVI